MKGKYTKNGIIREHAYQNLHIAHRRHRRTQIYTELNLGCAVSAQKK